MSFKSCSEQTEKDEHGLSWYKEMVRRVCEMCHSNSGSVSESSSGRTKFLDYSMQPFSSSVCTSCQQFLDLFPCYRFFSPPEKLIMSTSADRRFYNTPFLNLDTSYLIGRKIILSFLHNDIDSTWQEKKQRLLFSEGPREVRSPKSTLAFKDVHVKALKPSRQSTHTTYRRQGMESRLAKRQVATFRAASQANNSWQSLNYICLLSYLTACPGWLQTDLASQALLTAASQVG